MEEVVLRKACGKLFSLSKHVCELYDIYLANQDTDVDELIKQINSIISWLIKLELTNFKAFSSDIDPTIITSKQYRFPITVALSKWLACFYSSTILPIVVLVYEIRDVNAIQSIWSKFNTSCHDLHQRLHRSDLQWLMCPSAEWDLFIEQHDKQRHNTDIFRRKPMFITQGFVRQNTHLQIPICLTRIISMSYEQMSFMDKMKTLFDANISMTFDDCTESHIFRSLKSLVQKYQAIFPKSGFVPVLFYNTHSDGIQRLFRRISTIPNDEYLTAEMNEMEYVSKIQGIINITHLAEALDSCIGILIPSFIHCVLIKHRGNYGTLVTGLHKIYLKRIYDLFRQSNAAEAKRLNDA